MEISFIETKVRILRETDMCAMRREIKEKLPIVMAMALKKKKKKIELSKKSSIEQDIKEDLIMCPIPIPPIQQSAKFHMDLKNRVKTFESIYMTNPLGK